MKKIVHLGYYHKYDDGRILRKECASLKAALDADITYITSDRNGIPEQTEINGVKLRVIPAVNKRFVRLFAFHRDALKAIEEIGPNVCHIHEFVLFPLAARLKRRGIRVILDLHENDVEDETEKIAARHGKAAGRLAHALLLAYERWAVKHADAVISVTPQIIERVQKYGKPTEMVANYPWKDDGEPQSFESFCGHLDTLCFAGGISESWGILTAMEAMRDEPSLRLRLAGRGEEAYLEKLRAHPAWERTEYLGSVSFARVKSEIYAKSSIGLALLSWKDGWIGEEGTLGNTKLFEFMQFGLPVICTDYRLWKAIVEKGRCGIPVDPFDVQKVREAIRWLRAHPREAYEMGLRGKQLIEQRYHWEHEVQALLRIYKKVGF